MLFVKKVFLTILAVIFVLSLSVPIFADGDEIPDPTPPPTLPGSD
jgi:hypothetical protein